MELIIVITNFITTNLIWECLRTKRFLVNDAMVSEYLVIHWTNHFFTPVMLLVPSVETDIILSRGIICLSIHSITAFAISSSFVWPLSGNNTKKSECNIYITRLVICYWQSRNYFQTCDLLDGYNNNKPSLILLKRQYSEVYFTSLFNFKYEALKMFTTSLV